MSQGDLIPTVIRSDGVREFIFSAVREPARNTDHSGIDAECSKILLVGEDNPQSPYLVHTLVNYPNGCTGHRLQEQILGLVSWQYLACWRMNLCAEPNLREHGYQDGKWKKSVAEQIFFRDVMHPRAPWELVILLGSKVRSVSFGSLTDSFQTLTSKTQKRTFVTLPHPSGRCREWNDYANYGRAQKLLRQYTTLPIGGP